MSDTVNFPRLYRIIYAFFKNVVKTILCKTQTYYNLPLLVLVIKWYKVQLKKNFTSDAFFFDTAYYWLIINFFVCVDNTFH